MPAAPHREQHRLDPAQDVKGPETFLVVDQCVLEFTTTVPADRGYRVLAARDRREMPVALENDGSVDLP